MPTMPAGLRVVFTEMLNESVFTSEFEGNRSGVATLLINLEAYQGT